MRKLSLISLLLLCVSCTTKTTGGFSEKTPKTYLISQMAPLPLLLHTEQFLEWSKGYSFRIRDQERGILVTDWIYDTPLHKHQITLRVNRDVKGSSMLSAHTSFQEFVENQWIELPSNYRYDADLIEEIRNHIEGLQKSSGERLKPQMP